MDADFCFYFVSTYLQPDEGAGHGGGSGPHEGGGPCQSADGQETEVSNFFLVLSSFLSLLILNIKFHAIIHEEPKLYLKCF